MTCVAGVGVRMPVPAGRRDALVGMRHLHNPLFPDRVPAVSDEAVAVLAAARLRRIHQTARIAVLPGVDVRPAPCRHHLRFGEFMGAEAGGDEETRCRDGGDHQQDGGLPHPHECPSAIITSIRRSISANLSGILMCSNAARYSMPSSPSSRNLAPWFS